MKYKKIKSRDDWIRQ